MCFYSSPFVLHQKHIISSTQLPLVSLNYVMLSKFGTYDTPKFDNIHVCTGKWIIDARVSDRYLHESQNLAAGGGAGAGGKTPYGAGRMTPGRTPGFATPGHMSVRQPSRTPNPFAGVPSSSNSNAATTGSTYGGSTQYGGATSYGGASSYGYETPRSTTAGPPQPSGLNPARAAMIQNASAASGSWSTSGSWR